MAKTRKAPEQTEMVFRPHGGKRRGAGRPPRGRRPGMAHTPRPDHHRRYPVHVTIRVVADVSSLCRATVILTPLRQQN